MTLLAGGDEAWHDTMLWRLDREPQCVGRLPGNHTSAVIDTAWVPIHPAGARDKAATATAGTLATLSSGLLQLHRIGPHST